MKNWRKSRAYTVDQYLSNPIHEEVGIRSMEVVQLSLSEKPLKFMLKIKK
ncbi:hypothetical protein [Clostridium folliculivorans]|nr:hypothetical protein [Clostridium folliculivorans]